jgi:two-component system response regulator DesR
MNANKQIKVVLVDDSSLVRERVASALAALEGVEVVGQASDVPAGKLLLQAHQPDVLILDIDLPGETGLDLLQYGNIQRQSLLIIMLTNYDHPKLRERCAELGANFYFHKTSEIEKTMDVCRELAARRASPAATELQKQCRQLEELMRECMAKLKEAHANMRGELPNGN